MRKSTIHSVSYRRSFLRSLRGQHNFAYMLRTYVISHLNGKMQKQKSGVILKLIRQMRNDQRKIVINAHDNQTRMTKKT